MDKIQSVLSLFYLDSELFVTRIFNLLDKIYFQQVQKKSIPPSRSREKVALVYCILRVLNEEGAPRPMEFIANACLLPPSQRKRVLKMERELRLEGKMEFIDAAPGDFVSSICAHLNISFSVSQQAELVLSRDCVRWGLYGHKPHYLAVAAIARVMQSRNMTDRVNELCEVVGCLRTTIQHIMSKIPVHICME